MAVGYWQKLRLIGRDAWLVLCVWVLVGLTLNGVCAVLNNLYLLRLGYDARFIGLAGAVGALTYAGIALLAGLVGMHWSSRTLMLVGTMFQILGYALTPLVEFWPMAWRSGWLLGAAAARWAGLAFVYVGATPFMVHVTTPAERDYVFGLQMTLFPLGGVVGALIGGLLPQAFAGPLGMTTQMAAPYRYALCLPPLLMALGLLAVWNLQGRAAEPKAELHHIEGGHLPLAIVGVVALIYMLRWMGQAPTNVFFNVYLDSGLHSPVTVGCALALWGYFRVPRGEQARAGRSAAA